MRVLSVLALTAIVGLAVAGEAHASACSTTKDGNWGDSTVWSCGTSPGAGDTASIAHTVTVSDARSIFSVTLLGGTLAFSGGGSLTDSGPFTATSGNIQGNGTLTVNGGFVKNNNTRVNIKDLALVILNGESTHNDGEVCLRDDGGGDPTLQINSSYTLAATIATSSPFPCPDGLNTAAVHVANGGSIVNQRTGGDTTLVTPIENDGLVTTSVAGQTLTLFGNAPATSSGDFTTQTATSTLEFGTGTTTLGASSDLSGSGTLATNGNVVLPPGATLTMPTLSARSGTLTITGSGNYTPATININGGTIDSTRSPTGLTTLTATAGTLQGPATVAPTATFTKSSSGRLNIADAANLTIAATATATHQDGEVCLRDDGGGDPTLQVDGVYTLAATIATDSPFPCPDGLDTAALHVVSGGSIVNQRSGADTTLVTPIDNDGLVSTNAPGQTLTLSSGNTAATSSGDFTTQTATSTLRFGAGTTTLGANSDLSGSGTLTTNGNVILPDGATLTMPTLTATAGTLTITGSGPYTPATINVNGGAIDSTRNPTGLATLTATAGTLQGPATLTPTTTFTKSSGGRLNIKDQADLVLNPGVTATHQDGEMCLRDDGGGDPMLQINTTYTLAVTIATSSPFPCPDGLDGPAVTIGGPSGLLIDDRSSATAIVTPTQVAGGGAITQQADDDLTFSTLVQTGGAVTVTNGATLAVTSTHTQSGGTTTVAGGGTLSGSATHDVSGGTLTDNGTINGNVALSGGGLLNGANGTVNGMLANVSGTVAPGSSPGTLTVNGPFTQGAGGTLDIDVTGTSPGSEFDRLLVNGPATLDGTVAVHRDPGFDPADADTFQFLTSTSRSGTFATLSGATLTNSRAFELDYPGAAVFGARLIVNLPPPPTPGTPFITGTAEDGQQLTCNTGTWTGNPTFAFEWLRDGTAIGSATAQTYTVVDADVQHQLTCRVTGTNAGGSVSATSAPVAIPAVAPTMAKPTIDGTVEIGKTLTCEPQSVTGVPAPTLTFAWLRDGTVIGGATTDGYTLAAADADKQIACKVTATNAGGSADATSAAVSPAAPPAPTPTPSPTPSPTPTPVTPTAQETALAAASPAAVAQAFGLPAAKTCVSRRAFKIKIKQPTDVTIASATIQLGAKKIKAKKVNGRFTATVDLRGLKKGRFTILITVKTVSGKTLKGSRSYKTCAKRQKGSGKGGL
jgi:hypothetical protein